MKTKVHLFNIEEAELYGVHKAILIYNIRYWLEKNQVNDKNWVDGFYWTYNSAEAFAKMFPYMSASSIMRWLGEMEKDGIIKTANHNKNSFDRTKWYTIVKEFNIRNDKSISQSKKSISQIEKSYKETDRIPDRIPNTSPLSSHEHSSFADIPQGEECEKSPLTHSKPSDGTNTPLNPKEVADGDGRASAEVFEHLWVTYGRIGSKKAAKSLWNRLSAEDREKMEKHLPLYVKSTPEKRYRKHLERYIKGELWDAEIVNRSDAAKNTSAPVEPGGFLAASIAQFQDD